MTGWLNSKGVLLQPCPAYSSESNGKAETLNSKLNDKARTMLKMIDNTPCSRKLWAEAGNTANCVRNRKFVRRDVEPKVIPFKAFTAKKPGILHFRIFVSQCYVHIPNERRLGSPKYENRTIKGILVGYQKQKAERNTFLM